MENHIYPLNIEEPSPLSPKNKRKKPSFKEWAKERKKMIVFVCTVAVLALATVTIYATGLSDKMLGLIYDKEGNEVVIIAGQEGTKEKITGYNLDYEQIKKEVEENTTKNATLALIYNTGSIDVYTKARLVDDSETINSTEGEELKEGNSKSIGSSGFSEFINLTPGNYTLSVKVFSKESNMSTDPKKETYLEIINAPFTITPKPVQEPLITVPLVKPTVIDLKLSDVSDSVILPGEIPIPPEITIFSLAATPKGTNEVDKESSFLVKVTGGTAPYEFNIDFDDGNVGTITKTVSNGAKEWTFKHAYSKAGTYKILAKVKDNFGKEKSKSIQAYVITDAPQDIKITYETKTEPLDYVANKDVKQEIVIKNPAVILSLTGAPASPSLAGTEVTFKLEATAGATSYNFRIEYGPGEGGDVNAGSKSNIVTFKHKYEKAGTYTVSAGVTSTLNVNDPVNKETTYKILDAYQCSNGIDDDKDEKIDLKDPGCDGADDNDEADIPVPPKAQCNDGIDNDTNGKIDYPSDLGCAALDDITENQYPVVVTPPSNSTPEPPLTVKETKCDDGKDNDNDGKKDYEDSDCKAPKDASIKITEVGVTNQKLNPALNAVKIYYKLSDSANVKVEMKNAKGDVTVPLFEGKQMKQVGNFSVWWEGTLDNKPNGQKAPDGTYTYKISATHLKYPSVKDSKEGTITVDSTYNPGGLDFEDINNANLVGDTGQGQGTGAGQTPSTPSQNQATVVIQSATTGSTAGTGPGVVIYFLFPLFAYAYKKIKY